MKNKDFFIDTNPKKNKVWLKSKDRVINRLHNHNIHLDSVKIENNKLVLSGFFSSNCKNEVLTIKTILNSKKTYNAQYVESEYENRKIKNYLGIDWKFNYNFNLEIPLINNDFKFKLFIDYLEGDKYIEMSPDINFKEHCNISFDNPTIYCKKHQINFENNEFHVIKKSLKERFKLSFL